jgi:hypothetical protein
MTNRPKTFRSKNKVRLKIENEEKKPLRSYFTPNGSSKSNQKANKEMKYERKKRFKR